MAGASWFELQSKSGDGEDATFVVGTLDRRLARSAASKPKQRYVEPYGTFGVLDPDTEVIADLAFEAAAGVNVGLWQRFRASLQGEICSHRAQLPAGLLPRHRSGSLRAAGQLGVTF